jgi:putative PIN family toxin of toxin-antitoxin system
MIVIDTNVLVAAVWSQTGASYRIMRRAIDGDLRFAVSVALALEYEDVLTRSQVREASWASDADIDTLINNLIAEAVLIAPIDFKQRPALRDSDDDMVLECAVQAQAKAIVTMNLRDFANVPKTYGIAVMRPGDWLSQLKEGAS